MISTFIYVYYTIMVMKQPIKYSLIILATALIVGGGTYFIVHHQSVDSKKMLSSQVISLRKNVSVLNAHILKLENNKTPSPASLSVPSNACTSSDLSATLLNGTGAAGTAYYNLQIKNTSNKTCLYSGVTAIFPQNSSGSIVGGDATTNAVANFKLSANESIYSDVGFPNPGNFSPGECASGVTSLAVYPPGESKPLTINITGSNYTNSYCPGFSMNAFSTKPIGG